MEFPTGYSPERYWTEFEVRESDLDYIYNVLLDREVPVTIDQMAIALINHRLENLESEITQVDDTSIEIYLPAETFQVGQKILFPAIGNRIGNVVGVRGGENPNLGEFDVIQVEFQDEGRTREFAARLENHKLNHPLERLGISEEANTPEEIIAQYGVNIISRLQNRLEVGEDIVQIAGKWFPQALLVEFHEGHLNLAEAILDVAGGGPTPTNELLKHIEIPAGLDPLLAEFSLDYALQEDQRFDEVGPAGQIIWHLKRLEPPEVLYTPTRLVYEPQPHDRSVLPPSLLALEEALDDEFSPLDPLEETLDEVVLSLLFPHWRVGTLPLSRRLRPLFPTAYEAPRIRFMLIDGHSGDKFPGWVVREQRYVFGLDNWYRRHEVPAGGLVRIRKSNEPGEVVVETVDRRRRNDWIRTVSIGENGRIGFTMLKQPVGTGYDDLMVVGLIDPIALDEAWFRGGQKDVPVDRLVAHVFRELAKLNPQSAVHAQSLYSGVNVIRRLPPGPIFTELLIRPYYLHVGDLYWRFDESVWSQL